MGATGNKHSAYWPMVVALWGKQFALLLLLSGLLWHFDSVLAYSAMLGCLVYWIPNAYFARLAFRYSSAQFPTMSLQSIYRGEIGKFLLTAMGFAVIFVCIKPLSHWAMFTAYLAMIISQWFFMYRWR